MKGAVLYSLAWRQGLANQNNAAVKAYIKDMVVDEKDCTPADQSP